MKSKLTYWLRASFFCLIDCVFLFASEILSGLLYTYLLKNTTTNIFGIYLNSAPLAILGCFIIFMAIGVHKTLLNHISLIDIIKIGIAVLSASFWAYCALRINEGYWQNPILAVTTFFIFLSLSIGVRLIPTFHKMVSRRDLASGIAAPRIRVLIVGAGSAADALIKDTRDDNENNYKIIGLVDDDEKKKGRLLRGVNVLGSTEDLQRLTQKHNVHEILIAIPSATIQERQRLFSSALTTGCKVRSMSRVSSFGAPTVADLHDIDIADLLGRQEVYLSPDVMATYITGRVILVTGGGGSIGSELCRQIMRFEPKQLVIFDMYENSAHDILQELRVIYHDKADYICVRIGSVQDRPRLDDVFTEFKPNIVFHAAAYKHVPLMEECPRLAIENNVFGTYNVARMAIKYEIKRFVMISTDKAVNPANIMGASKRLSELIIHSMNGQGTEFVAVRFGNVLGSNGSVVPIFRRQIEAGHSVTVTHPEVIRYFMTIPEASQLVLQAASMAHGGETFVLDMGEPVKIEDLARSMIEMAGLAPGKDIEIVYTGLRPGEKLYEELLLSGEGTKKTVSDKIFVAKSDIISGKERRAILEKLHGCLKHNEDVKQCVTSMLDTYKPG